MPESGIVRDFIGLNKVKPETNLAPNEAFEAKNVVFSDQMIAKRLGSERFSPWTIPTPACYFTGNTYRKSPPISSSIYNSLGYRFGTQFTLEVAGFFESGSSTDTQILSQRAFQESGGVHGWSLRFNKSDNTFNFKCMIDVEADVDVTGTWTGYSPRKPFHLALRRDGANAWLWLEDAEGSGQIGAQAGIGATSVETQTVNTYPMTFGTGIDPTNTNTIYNLDGRLQEFRTWDYARSTASVSEWALKELTPHATATNSLQFYYKFNEGDGVAYDYGYIARAALSTMTNAFAVHSSPSQVKWTDGLVTGGLGDDAVELNGLDQYAEFQPLNDEWAVFRTGTSAWSFQANVMPLDEVADGAVFYMHGSGGYAFAYSTVGFAFRIRAATDKSIPSATFIADWAFETQTVSITWSTSFTSSISYGLNLQRTIDEVGFRVDDLTNGIPGVFLTAAVASPGAPQFPAASHMYAGAAYPYPAGGAVTGYAHCRIDEIRMWDGVRREPQNITYAYPGDPQLLGYWKCNDGSGDTIVDSSGSYITGYTHPVVTTPTWAGGWVEPVNGPEVTGLFYYQKNVNLTGVHDARDRTLLTMAGNSIYRNEGGVWNELETGRKQGELYSGGQLGNHMIVCNGQDENRLYDGDGMWAAGLEPPTANPEALAASLTGFFWEGFSASNLVLVDQERTEPTGSFDGKRVDHNLGSTGTISTRCHKYYDTHTFTGVIVGGRLLATDSNVLRLFHMDWSEKGTNPLPLYGIEQANLIVHTTEAGPIYKTNTLAITIESTYDTKNKGWERTVGVATAITSTYYQLNNNLILNSGTFIWDTQYTHTVLTTHTYEISLSDAALAGNFYYRYTNLNNHTKIQSNPSPPSDDVATPNTQAVNVTIPYSTDTSVTDRLVWRTKVDGARNSQFYFFVGTATGTGTTVFKDVTPAGDELDLVSFYRSKPPKSYISMPFKGRMWYVPVQWPNLLYFSDVDRPTDVDGYNYLIFGNESDHITALGVYEDNLVVWKRRSTWIVGRTDVPVGASPIRISDTVGCVAPGSVRECNGELLFLGDNGIYSLRGSDIRSVSKDKVHYYIKKLDPARLHKAVASNIEVDGIYRLNLTPHSVYATTVDADKNSWYLDYHYDRSRNHVPFYESIWSYGEREVSCYGEYVAEDGRRYQAFGNYVGQVHLGDVPEVYSEGLGWYRGVAAWTTFADLSSGASSGDYTLTVAGSMFTGGHGLKGLRVYLRSSSASEDHVCAWNTGQEIILQTALASDYATGANIFIAPIVSRYRSGMYDFGSSIRDKKVPWVKVDHGVTTDYSTMTVGIYGGRGTTIANQTVQTHTMHLNVVNEKIGARVRGKHAQIEFQHDWPGRKFEIYNWEWMVEGGRAR